MPYPISPFQEIALVGLRASPHRGIALPANTGRRDGRYCLQTQILADLRCDNATKLIYWQTW